MYASGLTNLADLAFAPDGSLYAVEIASNGLLNGPIGALVKINPGSNQHETVAGGLFAPYGVAFGRGAAYVTPYAVCTGGGQVIKIELDEEQKLGRLRPGSPRAAPAPSPPCAGSRECYPRSGARRNESLQL